MDKQEWVKKWMIGTIVGYLDGRVNLGTVKGSIVKAILNYMDKEDILAIIRTVRDSPYYCPSLSMKEKQERLRPIKEFVDKLRGETKKEYASAETEENAEVPKEEEVKEDNEAKEETPIGVPQEIMEKIDRLKVEELKTMLKVFNIEWLCDRVLKEKDPNVRQAAMEVIAEKQGAVFNSGTS